MKTISKFGKVLPKGHYSPAIIHNDTIYVSGQFSIDPQTGEQIFGSVEEETNQVLHNIELILKEVGSDRNKVLKTTVYIPDIQLWIKVNDIYAAFFGGHKPARTIIVTKEIHFGFQIEIDAIAAL